MNRWKDRVQQEKSDKIHFAWKEKLHLISFNATANPIEAWGQHSSNVKGG